MSRRTRRGKWRERYLGEWLPEPLPWPADWVSRQPAGANADPADRVALDESVSGQPEGSSAGLNGIDDGVAQVRMRVRIEGAPTCDEAKLWIGDCAVYGQRGKPVLGVHLHSRDAEHH
jgi:hypothetical protein